jgi:KUP system potassium uptake protein
MDTKDKKDNKKFLSLVLGSMGVVFGDIGTSPLYTIKNCFTAHHIPLNMLNILGISSLIFWTLLILVSFKYVYLILNLDYKGEGGILTLTKLCSELKNKFTKIMVTIGVIGSALFFGDAVITPAISVLGALEGLSLISDKSTPYIIPLSLIIITLLFLSQKKGSAKIGILFGPIILLWFASIGYLGLIQILKTPAILQAINPYYAFNFLLLNKFVGLLTLGSVALTVTGAEALYADIGHFGKKPIRFAWYFIIFPLLIFSYFGQAALLIANPQTIANPFYLLAPNSFLYPLIILASFATIIASQSVISGCFSLCYQAMKFGFLPEMKVIHTSTYNKGQVYIPVVNYLLFTLVVVTILLFKSSEKLASIYGIAITSIMLISTILASYYLIYKQNWSFFKCLFILAPIFTIDFIFFASGFTKFLNGGWFAFAISLLAYIVAAIRIKLSKSSS